MPLESNPEFTPPAATLWQAIPAANRTFILANL